MQTFARHGWVRHAMAALPQGQGRVMKRGSLSLSRGLRLVLLSGVFVASQAVQAAIVCSPSRPDDQVNLNLSAEVWATAATPRVLVGFEAAGRGAGESADLRAAVRASLKKLDAGADWRITRFDKVIDPAGLERVSGVAEARLSENKVHGLAAAAKSLSRAGHQIRVDGIEFSPSRAELEAAQAAGRQRIYADINREVERLRAAFPKQSWRVANVAFVPEPPHVMQLDKRMMAAAESEPESDAESDFEPASSDLVTVVARVSVAAMTQGACGEK
jgi:hypothetical protein